MYFYQFNHGTEIGWVFQMGLIITCCTYYFLTCIYDHEEIIGVE